MPRQATKSRSDARPAVVKVRIRLENREQLPIYVNHLIVNYIQDEFILNLVHVSTPTFRGPDDVVKMKEIPGQVVFRAVIPKAKWIEAVKSFSDQIESLGEQGALIAESREESPDDGPD